MRVVFISNNLASTHDKNRIEEFIANGADVIVYGFTRTADDGRIRDSSLYSPTVVGNIEPTYIRRIRTYWNAIKQIRKKHKYDNCIYYLFGFDIGLTFMLQRKNESYIYEEADLVYTYIHNNILVRILKCLDEIVIKKSYKTVLTSEGFIKYHFQDVNPQNIVLIENKLSKEINSSKGISKNTITMTPLKVGFVGAPRFNSILNFIKVFCTKFPMYEFHIYGAPVPDSFSCLKSFSNCFFHGRFTSPIDLPDIYSNIDLVLCTYDVTSDNVKYAEPNKIYESIYFETPILVSKGTFLSEKVERLGIGYSIDAMDDDNIESFIKGLTIESIVSKADKARQIPKDYCINNDVYVLQEILMMK